MKFGILIIASVIASIVAVNAEPMGNDYGFANAWFNGKEATVYDAKLKIGEPAEIKVTVTSNISGHVFVKLTNPLVTEAYKVVDGPNIGETIDNYDVPSGWTKTYRWVIAPNGAWTNGNAPINVFAQFHRKEDNRYGSTYDKTIEFTIANPYILPERYEGAPTATAPTATASV
ncbi:MAG TPA: sarcinarray family MAST domain-containing protein, partial [Candidatus Methanoperedenaceae archaeon]|nr:sarcinarray family MAST domain-containing protein [Candidatus Methanoperedenaceae archaeon]